MLPARTAHQGKPERQIAQPEISVEGGGLDAPFLLLTLVLVVIGLGMLFSASYARASYEEGHNAAHYFIRQGLVALAGIGLMLLISRLDYHLLGLFAKPIMAGVVILLVLTLVIGTSEGGAKRWLNLGISFQPSELAKLGVIILFAALMTKNAARMHTLRYGFLPYLGILGTVAALLFLEPHMSATLIILAVGFVMMILGGTNKKHLLILVLLGLALVAAYLLTKGYTGDRITAWMDPEADPTDKGYQTLQSQYAIGSGGFFGLGLGHSRQKYLYLPEEHNDYIFAIICEELGFVGAVSIILLFSLLILRGFWIALHARDRFGVLLAAGLSTLLAVQVFLNMGVVSNLLPSTGISLPLFSYGGTALLIQLAEMGIILSVSRWDKNKRT